MRVALLLRSPMAPAWMAGVARALLSSDAFSVSAFICSDGDVRQEGGVQTASLSDRIVNGLLRQRRGPGAVEQDPFALLAIEQAAPTLSVEALPMDHPRSHEDVIDVAVAADTALAKEDLAARGLSLRLGCWHSPELDCRDGRADLGAPSRIAGMAGLGHVSVTVEAVGAVADVPRPVIAADASLESLLVTKNRAEAAWGAASLMLAALEHASREVPVEALPAAEQEPPGRAERVGRPDRDAVCGSAAPTTRRARLLPFAGRVIAGVARRAALKRQWILAYHVGSGLTLQPTADTRFVIPPADRFWADPHVVYADGDYHVFYEEFSYNTGKGHIATMRLGDDGPLSESQVALTSDTHLSYPFVFAFDGNWFMIPESSEARRIDVFRAEAFPTRWTLAATLMRDLCAVDTTMVEHDGRWWLLTTIRKLSGGSSLSHLYLFSADGPLSEVWEPHPMNPIASGAAGARAAGSIMTLDQRLVRPSQDSRGGYGRGIELSEIVTMTREEYAEKPAGGLEPNESRGFIGLHTISQARDLTIVDLCRWTRRL